MIEKWNELKNGFFLLSIKFSGWGAKPAPRSCL